MNLPEFPDFPLGAALLPRGGFAALEEAVALIKDEEMARMVALAARHGGQLSPGQRRACLERFADRIAAARTSVYRRSLAHVVATDARPLPAGPTDPGVRDEAAI
jgi:hypothetical protein